MTTPSGFLLIDKPAGPTSHDVVAVVRRLLGGVKVGHAGTLDPLATGLLIVGVGQATKNLGRLLGLDKTYEVIVQLGATSATDDAEGPITENPCLAGRQANVKILMSNEVEAVLKNFLGEQEQLPPVYSAKKQGGVPLYKKARQGKVVTPKLHRVMIHSLELKRYAFPELDLIVTCSSGTYIRSMARDIGAALKVGGYVARLHRTHIGPFNICEAIALEALRKTDPTNLLINADKLLKRIPFV